MGIGTPELLLERFFINFEINFRSFDAQTTLSRLHSLQALLASSGRVYNTKLPRKMPTLNFAFVRTSMQLKRSMRSGLHTWVHLLWHVSVSSTTMTRKLAPCLVYCLISTFKSVDRSCLQVKILSSNLILVACWQDRESVLCLETLFINYFKIFILSTNSSGNLGKWARSFHSHLSTWCRTWQPTHIEEVDEPTHGTRLWNAQTSTKFFEIYFEKDEPDTRVL